MKRTKWNPRKVLIASAGLASVNYAVASGCGGDTLVANLVLCPVSECPPGGSGGASVANLVAPPPGGNGGFAGASVANLVAPPPGGSFNSPDGSAPDPDAPDAAPDASPDAADAADGAA